MSTGCAPFAESVRQMWPVGQLSGSERVICSSGWRAWISFFSMASCVRTLCALFPNGNPVHAEIAYGNSDSIARAVNEELCSRLRFGNRRNPLRISRFSNQSVEAKDPLSAGVGSGGIDRCFEGFVRKKQRSLQKPLFLQGSCGRGTRT